MTTWGDLEVGNRIIYDGGENEGEHIVRVLKRGSLGVRAVLEPCVEHKAAKISVRARLDEEVELAEGSTAPDRAGTAIAEVLGAKEVASAKIVGDTFVCPPVDVLTVASHLRIMHGVELEGLPASGEAEWMRVHRELHETPFHEPRFAHQHEEKAA